MSKSKHILLPSRGEGWELWRLGKDGNTLVEVFAIHDEIAVPASTKIAFASHDVASWPLILPKNDKQVQREMAQLNLEQNGFLSGDSDVWDVFCASDDDNVFTGAVLSRNSLAHDSSHTNQTFDVTARLYQVGPGDCVLCKREHGKWVSILYKSSIPFYWEPIDSLDSLSSQLKVLSLEFAQQKIPFAPERLIIEMSEEELAVNNSEIFQLEAVCDIKVDCVQSVDFRDDTQHDLNLAPISVNLERKSRRKRRGILLLILLVLLAYCVAAFFLYERYKSKSSEIETLEDEVALLSPGWQQNQQNLAKLNELDDVMTNKWPLALFEKVVSHLPKSQSLRFQIVEIQPGFILIKGVSPNINLINKLYPTLQEDEYFENYRWRMPAPVINEKTKLWEFTMEITNLDLAE